MRIQGRYAGNAWKKKNRISMDCSLISVGTVCIIGTIIYICRGITMKKLTVKKGSECMACLECVRACSNAFYKEFLVFGGASLEGKIKDK